MSVTARRYLLIPWAIVALYIFAFRFPAAMDVPSHLARAFILNTCISGGSEPLCQNFATKFYPVSYFFPDFLLMLLLRVTSDPYFAGNILLFLMLSINLAGWFFLFTRIHSRPNAAYIAGLFLLLNNFFYKGFYAYLLGNGALLFWLGWWWPRRNALNAKTAIGLSLGLSLLFLCHLAAFFSAPFVVALYALWRVFLSPRSHRLQTLVNFLSLWPLALTFVSLYVLQQLETGPTILGHIGAQGWSPDEGIVRWMQLKLARLTYVYVNHAKYVDLAFFSGCCAVLLLFGLRSARVSLNNFWLIGFAGFVSVYVIAPDISHGGSDVDLRFLLPAYYFLFLWLGQLNIRGRVATTAITVVVLASVSFNAWHRLGMERELARVDRALSRIPPGQTLVEVNSRSNYPSGNQSRVNPFSHFSHYYFFRGGALVDGLLSCQMNPNIPYFCYRDERQAARTFHKQFEGLPVLSQGDVDKLSDKYHYILVIEPRASLVEQRFNAGLFERLYDEDGVYLFRSMRKPHHVEEASA